MLILRPKKYPASYWTRGFITKTTPYPYPSEFSYSHPIYSRSILVLSSGLNLDTYQARSGDDDSDFYLGAVRFDRLTTYPE
jgi:hypothetical protein